MLDAEGAAALFQLGWHRRLVRGKHLKWDCSWSKEDRVIFDQSHKTDLRKDTLGLVGPCWRRWRHNSAVARQIDEPSEMKKYEKGRNRRRPSLYGLVAPRAPRLLTPEDHPTQ
jgi:hypothetical protein